MKKRMEIKLKAVLVFDTEDENLIETLAETPLAVCLAFGLKERKLKVMTIEKAERTVTDLDRKLPPERLRRVQSLGRARAVRG